MNDDFNAPILVANIFNAVRFINLVKDGKANISSSDRDKLKKAIISFTSDVLGILPILDSKSDKVDDLMNVIIDLRTEARNNKDWKTADRIRDGLKNAGIQIKDNKDGKASWSNS